MKTIKFPAVKEWEALCKRPVINNSQLFETIEEIFKDINIGGDKALKKYTQQFDNVQLDRLLVSTSEIQESMYMVAPGLKEAMQLAADQIKCFHELQLEQEKIMENLPGVRCWQKPVPIENVGLYIPGGTAPLFSTVLMLGIPAKIAGCKNIVLTTPPDKEGKVNPAILYAAMLCGIDTIVKAGGAQAIAAMAQGTETIPKVDKIFGPGNQYVTAAKQWLSNYGVAYDMPAGPSEVLVIADNTSKPAFVAADLLSQAEHGVDSQVVLLTNSPELLDQVQKELNLQIENLPRKEIALECLEQSMMIQFSDLEECMNFSNRYAPEHLIIATGNYSQLKDDVINAGSVFLGNYTPESAGDYASGTNHTLPTNAFAKSFSGVNLDSYLKKITFQEIQKEGLEKIGPAISCMAENETLQAHSNAVKIRLTNLKTELK